MILFCLAIGKEVNSQIQFSVLETGILHGTDSVRLFVNNDQVKSVNGEYVLTKSAADIKFSIVSGGFKYLFFIPKSEFKNADRY